MYQHLCDTKRRAFRREETWKCNHSATALPSSFVRDTMKSVNSFAFEWLVFFLWIVVGDRYRSRERKERERASEWMSKWVAFVNVLEYAFSGHEYCKVKKKRTQLQCRLHWFTKRKLSSVTWVKLCDLYSISCAELKNANEKDELKRRIKKCKRKRKTEKDFFQLSLKEIDFLYACRQTSLNLKWRS